jgi:hypothetical protein
MILKIKLENYFSAQLKDSSYIAQPPLVANSCMKESHVKDRTSKIIAKTNEKGKENFVKCDSIDESTKNSNTAKQILPDIKPKPKLLDSKKKTIMLDNYESMVADKNRKISELTEALNLMEKKLQNVEELLVLKDEKIKILKRGLKKG